MTKFCIDVDDTNIKCWEQYKRNLAAAARRYAEEKGVKLGEVIITDNDALSGLFDCVENEGIFCWGLLWDIIKRTAVMEDKDG